MYDYKFDFREIPIKCDDTSVINIIKNTIQHFRMKHIEIKHYFILDHMHSTNIVLDFIFINDQFVDIFTKPLDNERFYFIRNEIGICPPLD